MKQIAFPPCFSESLQVGNKKKINGTDLVFNVPKQSLELLFKLSTYTRTGHDGGKVKREDSLVVQRLP